MARLAVVLVLCMSTLVARAAQPVPDREAQPVSANTYVIHGPTEMPSPKNLGFMNNPGFVVTAEGVVVVDPGSSLESGRMVLRQVRGVTRKPVTHVFNTHIHGDHWLGNQAIAEKYPDVVIYAHPEMIAQARGGAAEEWVELMERLTGGATRGTEAVIPGEVLSDGQTVEVGGIRFIAHLSDTAHSGTDAMIEVVEESVLFTGDNVVNQRVVRMDDASFRGSIEACALAEELALAVYVPGHGPTGGVAVVSTFKRYLETLYERVAALYEEGMEDFEMKEAVVAELGAYQGWPGFDEEIGRHISLAVLEVESAQFE